MTKIYTRTGDKGETSLFSGERVPKYSLRVEAYGSLDELNSWIGFVRSINNDQSIEAKLAELQPQMHVLCSDLANPLHKEFAEDTIPRIKPEADRELEIQIDRMEEELEPLKNFILPGGGEAGAALQAARAVCRRAERIVHQVRYNEGGVNEHALKYLNRLSDYLFTLARWANKRAGVEETIWKGREGGGKLGKSFEY